MPPNVVKTKKEEELWDKAKGLAADQGHKEDYPYIMGIFKKMLPDRFSSVLANKLYKIAKMIESNI